MSQRTTNRRAFARKQPKAARCRCRKGIMGLGPDLALALLDLAQSGASLLVKAPLEPKQLVVIELDGVICPKPVSLDAQVVRCDPTPEGAYVVGVRFQRNLPYAELQRLT
jgi:hypothetical protein